VSVSGVNQCWAYGAGSVCRISQRRLNLSWTCHPLLFFFRPLPFHSLPSRPSLSPYPSLNQVWGSGRAVWAPQRRPPDAYWWILRLQLTNNIFRDIKHTHTPFFTGKNGKAERRGIILHAWVSYSANFCSEKNILNLTFITIAVSTGINLLTCITALARPTGATTAGARNWITTGLSSTATTFTTVHAPPAFCACCNNTNALWQTQVSMTILWIKSAGLWSKLFLKLNYFKIITIFHVFIEKSPWTDFNQILYSQRNGGCNHLFQFWCWTIKELGICEFQNLVSPTETGGHLTTVLLYRAACHLLRMRFYHLIKIH